MHQSATRSSCGHLFSLVGHMSRRSGGPVQQLQSAIQVFDQRRVALHPVAIIAIQGPVDLPHLRAVDMPADHAVVPTAAGLCGHGHFDMVAYQKYFAGELKEEAYDEKELAMALSGLPSVVEPV